MQYHGRDNLAAGIDLDDQRKQRFELFAVQDA